MAPVRIDYYSDVLCVWAYVAQARMTELQQEFGARVEIRWRYLSVFGDVPGKFDKAWRARGGAAGYADHVLAIAADFPELQISDAVWRRCVPQSSAPAHLWLCAARLLSREREAALAQALRDAFFKEDIDISQDRHLESVIARSGLDVSHLRGHIDSGAAWAQLCADLQAAHEAQVQASPTLLFNEGRQRLTGNVGYRIIQANLLELMGRPAPQYSWC